MTASRFAAFAFLLSLPLLGSCSKNASAVVIALSSELPLSQVTPLSIEVNGDGNDNIKDFSSPTLPGTFTIDLGHAPVNTPVTITINAGTPVGTSNTFLTRTIELNGFSDQQLLLLDVPLRYSCIGVSCSGGETCINGTCESDTVSPSSLAPFPTSATYPSVASSTCFDDNTCIQSAITEFGGDPSLAFTSLDPQCTLRNDKTHGAAFAVPQGQLNLAVHWPADPTMGHWTVIDQDPVHGWSFSGDTIVFFPGLCTAMVSAINASPPTCKLDATSPSCLHVGFSSACSNKSPALPICP